MPSYARIQPSIMPITNLMDANWYDYGQCNCTLPNPDESITQNLQPRIWVFVSFRRNKNKADVNVDDNDDDVVNVDSRNVDMQV